MKKIPLLCVAAFLFGVSARAASVDDASVAAAFEPPPQAANLSREKAEWRRIGDFSRFARASAVPAPQNFPVVAAWRGEKVNFRVGIWAGEKTLSDCRLREKIVFAKTDGNAAFSAEIFPVNFAVGDNGAQVADIVDEPARAFSVPAGTLRELLVFVKIPENAEPGFYTGTLAAPQNLSLPPLEFSVEVLSATLPAPRERKIRLDIWQHPEAVARWVGAKLWSPEHFAALVPAMSRLRDLGQKTITCSIIEEPWSHQTFDDWSSMVKWTRERDGSWSFDYSAFDAWVNFMMHEIGISEQISCYSMLPWSMKIRYFDVASGTQKDWKLDVSSPTFDEIWGAFLSDFKKHLGGKGWLEKTCVAIDERPDAQLNAARRVVEKFAPELKIVSAHNNPSAAGNFVYDISPIFQFSGGDVPALAEKRRAEGKKTTFYVCVSPARPNTFLHSAPAEAHWLGFYAAANGFDGFLRWAYNSWNENPFKTTAFGNWPAGDCFLIYPENRSSLRLKRLGDGLEDFEKIQILRSRAAEKNAADSLKKSVAALDEYLRSAFTVPAGSGNAHESQVSRARELLAEAARNLR